MSSFDDEVIRWRDKRTSTPKQCMFLDFLTQRGVYEKYPSLRTFTPFGFYGGAGWGGKSYTLRTACLEIALDLRERGLPNMWGGLYTLTFPDLVGRHLTKFAKEFQGIAAVKKTQIDGLHLKFFGEGLGGVYLSNIASSSDTRKNTGSRRGVERSFGLIDESTEFSYDQFDTIKYQVRPDRKMPYIAIGMASNPDGIGHGWNKSIFHPEHRDLAHPFFEGYTERDIMFVKARKEDNPSYEANKKIIEGIFASISDPDIRKARSEGDWDIYASGRFPVFRASQNKLKENIHGCTLDEFYAEVGIPTDVPFTAVLEHAEELGLILNATLDYGTSVDSMTAILLFLVDYKGRRWWVKEIKIVGLPLERQAEIIHSWIRDKKRRLNVFYCDPALLAPQAEDFSGLSRINRFRDQGIILTPAINNRTEGWAACDTSLDYRKDIDGRLVKPPKSRFLFPCIVNGEAFGVPGIITQIPELPRDKGNPEDVDPMNGIWHWADCWRYGEFTYTIRGRGSAKPPVEVGTQAWLDALVRSRNPNDQRDIFGIKS